MARLECNEEVNCGIGGRGAKTLPVGRDSVPCMLHTYVTPKWCRRRRGVGEGQRGKDGGQREPVATHDHGEWELIARILRALLLET